MKDKGKGFMTFRRRIKELGGNTRKVTFRLKSEREGCEFEDKILLEFSANEIHMLRNIFVEKLRSREEDDIHTIKVNLCMYELFSAILDSRRLLRDKYLEDR